MGRPLLNPAPRSTGQQPHIATPHRWRLLNRLKQELWLKWQSSYLKSLQSRSKWKREAPNLKPGYLVLLKDTSLGTPNWPLAVITHAFPGKDQLVRVVELHCKGKIYRRPVTKLALVYASQPDESLCSLMDPAPPSTTPPDIAALRRGGCSGLTSPRSKLT